MTRRLYFSQRQALRHASSVLAWSCNISGRQASEAASSAVVSYLLGDPHGRWSRARLKRYLATMDAAVVADEIHALVKRGPE